MCEFDIADEALLSQEKKMRGYVLPVFTAVTIIDFQLLPAGNVQYSILVLNPNNGRLDRYYNWVKQEELLTKLQEFDLLCKQLNLA